MGHLWMVWGECVLVHRCGCECTVCMCTCTCVWCCVSVCGACVNYAGGMFMCVCVYMCSGVSGHAYVMLCACKHGCASCDECRHVSAYV